MRRHRFGVLLTDHQLGCLLHLVEKAREKVIGATAVRTQTLAAIERALRAVKQ